MEQLIINNKKCKKKNNCCTTTCIVIILCTFLFIFICAQPTFGATASISQSGADSGTVMKGKAFTLSVSGLSGSGTATVTVPSGFSVSEATTQSFSGSSVSWTTFTADQKLSSQTLSVMISTQGSPTTATTSSFNVVLSPSLTLSPTPTSRSVASAGSTFDLSLNIQNNGETTAQNVVATISSDGVFTSDESTKTVDAIGAGSSSAIVWSITAAESQTLTITVSSSNANTKTTTVSLECTDCTNDDDNNNNGGPGGGGAPGINNTARNNSIQPGTNQTRPNTPINPTEDYLGPNEKKINIPRAIGLLNNEKLSSAIEKVLSKGRLSDRAKSNLIEKSELIKRDIIITKKFDVANNKTKVTTSFTYNGNKTARNMMFYEVIPKSIADNAANINVVTEGRVEIVNPDPEYLITFPEVKEGDAFSIAYEFPGIQNVSVLDSIKTELYVESIEEPTPNTNSMPALKNIKKSTWFGIVIILVLIGIILLFIKSHTRKKIDDSKKN